MRNYFLPIDICRPGVLRIGTEALGLDLHNGPQFPECKGDRFTSNLDVAHKVFFFSHEEEGVEELFAEGLVDFCMLVEERLQALLL